MIKMGKWIAKHKWLILIMGFLLLIPSFLGMAATRVNYDLLSYLPETLETVKGQDVMVDEYGMGAFSMVVVENMELKDVAKLEDDFSQVEHVKDVLWYDDVADLSLPVVENTCPQDKASKRAEIKDLLGRLSERYPDLKSKIFGAMQRLPLEGWAPAPKNGKGRL